MNAVGKMDMVINIETFTQVKDSVTGQLTKTYSTWLVTWAEIMEASATEGEKTQQITSVDEKVFRIRYETGVTQKMRIYVPDLARYYDIKGISMEGRKCYLLIKATSHNINAAS